MIQNKNWTICDLSSTSSASTWSRMQDKLFEQALVDFSEETPDRWEKIAGQVPGKWPFEIKKHYEDLVDDVLEIESGRVEPPSYGDDMEIEFGEKVKRKGREIERKKGSPWTEEEHRLFLIGLQRYGKGDWRSISRNAVVSRTPTQVASHAQKYFLRLKSVKKVKKRSSIHDVTTAQIDSVGRKANHQTWVGIGQIDEHVYDPAGISQGFGFPLQR